MHVDLKRVLLELRQRRKFSAELYVRAKVKLINAYFADSGLSGCVLGVSGGVDSAVTLALLRRAAAEPSSPLKKIVCALMPMHIEAGTTGQNEATARGRETIAALGGDTAVIDLSQSHREMKTCVDAALDILGDPWAAGQLVSNLRTPALYYASSLLTQAGFAAIVVGTTNRDEGGYIGYFGKAADGLNDLQLISDLHKSEVYRLAEHLNVPRSVIAATPTGDIYDGRDDAQLIGASYEAIELYTLYLTSPDRDRLLSGFSEAALCEWRDIQDRLDTLNRQCAHKYIGGSVSAHLDVYERAVPGGWRVDLSVEETESYRARGGNFVAEFNLDEALCDRLTENVVANVSVLDQSAYTIDNLLSPVECADLVKTLRAQEWQAVGQNGKSGTGEKGSYRATAYSETFAQALWRRLAPGLPTLRFTDDSIWRPVGVSPALRFIRYVEGGVLVPHYDAPFEYWEGRRTLMSLVIYLTLPDRGGRTRLIRDLQTEPHDFSDWTRFAEDHEVTFALEPKVGSALLIDHRVLHDGEKVGPGAEKIILRTDIIFERAGLRKGPLKFKSKALGFPAAEELDARTLAKVNEDPFYAQVWRRFKTRAKLDEAGFFDDRQPLDRGWAGHTDTNWLGTPIFKIQQNLQNPVARPVVLFTTGGLSPVHACHLEMMNQAKAELERQGATVVGGYLSPSHDDYVQTKSNDMLDAFHRAHLCEKAVGESDWLMVDRWESLYAPTALNFTAVYQHLRDYLAAHVSPSIEIVYVFGGDNAGFVYPFLEQGRAVCVRRSATDEKFDRVADDPIVQACSRITLIHKPTAITDVSSRRIRRGESEFLPDRVRDLFLQWREAAPERDRISATLYIRDEQTDVVANWSGLKNLARVADGLNNFRVGVLAALKQVFAQSSDPNPLVDVDFQVVRLDEQRRSARKLAADHKIISIDPFIRGDYALAVSREFALASNDGSNRLVARPGHLAIAEQVRAIPPGHYILMDDDITTGGTMRRIKDLLPPEIAITDCVALLPRENQQALDTLDFRDFLIGTREGGLVMQTPDGQNVRAPYLLPYVSPAERASTPRSQDIEFSRQIWQLNLEFFSRVECGLKLRDVESAFGNLMRYSGFSGDDLLTRVCEWHLEKLVWAGNK